MASITVPLGAPVIVPPGKRLRKTSPKEAPVRPSTSETRCITWA